MWIRQERNPANAPHLGDVDIFYAHLGAMIHQVQEEYCEMSHQTMTQPELSIPQYTGTMENMLLQPV